MNKRQRIGLVLFLLMVSTNLVGTGAFFVTLWLGLMALGAYLFIKGDKK